MAILAIILGIIGGAIGMFFFDPNTGNRRRSLLRDQVVRFRRRAPDAFDALSRQTKDRAEGIVAETRSRLANEAVSDDVLAERVRSHLGRYVSHPSAINVIASSGEVTISGAILADEAARFMAALMQIPGVKQVHDQLQRYDSTEHIPDLQGSQTRTELR